MADLGVRGDGGYDPAALPRLAHALRETWRHGDGVALTLDGYRRAGGVDGAVARTAEQVYSELDDAGRDAARNLLLRLVIVPDEGPAVRRRADRDMLDAVDVGAGVLDRLVAARLVTVDGDGARIGHEALLTAWPRLRDWIDLDRAGLVQHRRLTEAATAWRESGAHDDDLYRGARLTALHAWLESAGDRVRLHPLERDFVTRSDDADRAGLVERPPPDAAAAGAGRRAHRVAARRGRHGGRRDEPARPGGGRPAAEPLAPAGRLRGPRRDVRPAPLGAVRARRLAGRPDRRGAQRPAGHRGRLVPRHDEPRPRGARERGRHERRRPRRRERRPRRDAAAVGRPHPARGGPAARDRRLVPQRLDEQRRRADAGGRHPQRQGRAVGRAGPSRAVRPARVHDRRRAGPRRPHVRRRDRPRSGGRARHHHVHRTDPVPGHALAAHGLQPGRRR